MIWIARLENRSADLARLLTESRIKDEPQHRVVGATLERP
jgi:hypothetical protein